MGSNFSGYYNRLLNLCPSSNMISSWSINHPSCNNLNDGSVYPTMYNSLPNTYIWSDGSVGDTLKNASAGIHTLFITDTNNCVEYHQFQLNDPYFLYNFHIDGHEKVQTPKTFRQHHDKPVFVHHNGAQRQCQWLE